MAAKQHVRLGDLLIDEGLITHEQLESVLAQQGKTKKRLGQLLIEMGLLLEKNLMGSLAKQFGLQLLSDDAF